MFTVIRNTSLNLGIYQYCPTKLLGRAGRRRLMNLPHGRNALLWLLLCLLGLPAPSTDILLDICLEDRLGCWVNKHVFEVQVYALSGQLFVLEPLCRPAIVLPLTVPEQIRVLVLHPPSA